MTRLAASRGVSATVAAWLIAVVSGCESVSVLSVEAGRVDVVPRSIELIVGESERLVATVQDANGAPLPGRSVAWTSSDPSVASVDPGGRVLGLAPGTAAITATSVGAAGSSVVRVGVPAQLVLSADSIGFVTTEGDASPAPQVLQITNRGGVTLTGLALSVTHHDPADDWLAASLSGSTAPATLTLTADPEGLAAGVYSALVEIRSERSANSPRTVDVSLRVHPVGPTIGLDRAAVRIQGETSVTDTVRVTNVGGGVLDGLRVAVLYGSSERGWLSAFLTSPSAPSDLVLTASGSALVPGVYEATLVLSSSNPAVDTVALPVEYAVAPPPASLRLSTTTVSLSAAQGQSAPVTELVAITNGGGGTLGGLSKAVSYAAGQPTGWLTATLAGTSAPTQLTVLAAVGSLAQGAYDASVEVSGDAANSPRFVAVRLSVGPPAGSLPLAPSGLSASAIDSTTVLLGWTDNAANELDFELHRSADGGQSWTSVGRPPADASSATDSGLSSAAQYDYRIRACNALGCSAFSNVATVITPAPVVAPNAPTGLSTSVLSAIDVDLTWTDASTNETGFEVERRTPSSTWTRITTEPPGTESLRVTGLSPGTTYEFRVRACAAAACSSWAGPATAVTPNPTTPPVRPTSFRAPSVTSGRVDLEWTDASSDETEFVLQRATGLLGTWQTLTTLAVNTEAYSDGAVQPRSFYRYRLAACNPAGCSAFTGTLLVFVP